MKKEECFHQYLMKQVSDLTWLYSASSTSQTVAYFTIEAKQNLAKTLNDGLAELGVTPFVKCTDGGVRAAC